VFEVEMDTEELNTKIARYWSISNTADSSRR
jgi:predicted transposase YbfD/YdcC